MTQATARIDWPSVHQRLEESARILVRSYEDDPDRRSAILRERAKILAGRRGSASDQTLTQVLAFGLADERYALPLTDLAAVLPERPLGHVPGLPSPLLGTLYHRAAVWPVYDLRTMLGLSPCSPEELRFRVVLMRDRTCRYGFRVDAVQSVLSLNLTHFKRSADNPSAQGLSQVRGIADDGLILLEGTALRPHRFVGKD